MTTPTALRTIGVKLRIEKAKASNETTAERELLKLGPKKAVEERAPKIRKESILMI